MRNVRQMDGRLDQPEMANSPAVSGKNLKKGTEEKLRKPNVQS
jgi:hypothetical protein